MITTTPPSVIDASMFFVNSIGTFSISGCYHEFFNLHVSGYMFTSFHHYICELSHLYSIYVVGPIYHNLHFLM